MRSEGRRVVIVVSFAALAHAPFAVAQQSPSLGNAASFAVLGGSAVTSSGPTVVTGNLGVSPGNTIDGFSSGQGSVKLGDIFRNDAHARAAQQDAVAAYNALADSTCTTSIPGMLSGSLLRGVYCVSSSALLTGTLLLDGHDDASSVWIFQIPGPFTTAPDPKVLVINGGKAGNVFWQVGSSATLGAGTAFQGNLLALGDITLNADASVSGRLLSRTGVVTLDSNSVSLCCDPLSLAPLTIALPDGTVGKPYSQTFKATGGMPPPYVFTLTSGSLPPGLSLLGSDGALSGTPSQMGTFVFTVTATDSHGCSGTRQYTTKIACPPLVLSPDSLPDAVCIVYNQTITASGGSGSYTYAASPSLPSGLTLDGAGVLSSTTALAPGDYTFTVTATDTVTECVATRTYTLHVNCNLTISPSTLPSGTVCTPYCQTLTASCGTPPYTFAAGSGLPAGLLLSPEGTLCGTPTTAGSSTFTVTATDAAHCTGSRTYTVGVTVISPPCTPCSPEVLPPTLPPGTVGTKYPDQAITASCGIGPYVCSVNPGLFPPGLTLTNCVVSGTPTAIGCFTFPVTVTDFGTSLTGSIAYSICVNCFITLSPAGLPGGTPGSSYTETITASGGTSLYSFSVTSGTLPPNLTLTTAGLISGVTTASGVFDFTITAMDATGCTGSRGYTIVVATGGPTLSVWGILVLSALLVGAGLLMIRKESL